VDYTSTENGSTKSIKYAFVENASMENTSTNLQRWKTQVQKRETHFLCIPLACMTLN